MHRPKRWNITPPHAGAPELAARLKASPLLAQVLLNRGISEPVDCQIFLRPSLKLLHDPALIPNLTRAAARVAKAIQDKQRIFIYGDYDVDGITATSILWHAITLLGGEAHFYVPHRIEEGYGLNADAITQICEQGAGLIISVDCGVTAIEPARVARERGVDLIITDHHEWREEEVSSGQWAVGGEEKTTRRPLLPDCFAVVHPRLPHDGPAYPNPHICGAGVAFKLAWGIGQAMSGASRVSEPFRNFLVEATGLAALGTIADVVPLVGENRVIAAFGLGGLKQTKLRGLQALIDSAGLTGQAIDSYDVGFKLAPRLNACGRMGHALLAVELLTKATEEKATEIAVYLEQQNKKRQTMEKQILAAAHAQVEENGFDQDDCHAVVLGAEGWHPGVIGIVASRIVDKLHRPTIMISLNNGHGQGSGRSIAGFHLTKALTACSELLETYGGHEMAAGLKIETAKFPAFREAFCDHAGQVLEPEMLQPELKLEATASLKEMSGALVNDLARLGPFGHGNRRPILCAAGLTVSLPPRRCGQTSQHLQLTVSQGGTVMKCIGFGLGEMAPRLPVGTSLDIAVEPILNEYNGRVSVELEIKDLRLL